MTFGSLPGGLSVPGCDEKESLAILNAYLDQGGNFIDTADGYAEGRSEEILGRGLKGRRDDVVLATKVFFPAGEGANRKGLSRKHIFEGIEESLRRLQTDYIDLYQVHCFDTRTPLEETLSALDALVRQGKVRYLGCSNFGAWQLAKALGVSALHDYARFDCLQPQYNLVCRPIEREILPLCRAEGVGIIAWSPLGGGFLSGKYRSGEGAPAGVARGGFRSFHAFLGGATFHGTELSNPARRWKRRPLVWEKPSAKWRWRGCSPCPVSPPPSSERAICRSFRRIWERAVGTFLRMNGKSSMTRARCRLSILRIFRRGRSQ